MIWIPSSTEAWEVVQVVSSDATSVTVKKVNGGPEFKVPGNLSQFSSVTVGELDETCNNLVNLETFNEGIILHHIKKRFTQDKIYTYVGNILIALNPYKQIDIYGLSVTERIYEQVKRKEDPPPHVFSIAAHAVFNMREEGKDQSILISGESGAGKTEATKKILQFISTICTSTASRIGPSIENQILDSNPLLESFGNAKTIRNNNSSRFGKYMEVNFDKKNSIKGCNITAYLLEKSRVVKQGPNERNYHIFYMLLAGATKEMRKDFALKPVDQYTYLAQSGCYEVDRRSDLKEFEDLLDAMNNLAIDKAMQNTIFQCLAAILHLGNLELVMSKDVEEGSRVSNPSDCRRVSTLLGLNADSLERALCNRESLVNGESLLVALNPSKAMDQRDSLAKFVYNKLFDFLIFRVNQSLYRGKPKNSIGVLDIFGFEVFQKNSFEQLCINYCNERLQTFFNEVIFEGEMKMYSAEGLPVDDISYQDNIGCVRLVDLRGGGIFAYLDEECAVPKGSDEKFISKLNQIFDENNTTKSPFFARNFKSPLSFTVRHFAGDVHYDATAFLEKNKDTLAESLVTLLTTSNLPLLTSDFTFQPSFNGSNNDNNGKKADNDSNNTGGSNGKSNKRSTKLTLSAKFKLDLDNLMSTLKQTLPHFVRCIKPNLEQVGNKFDSNLALNQLKYSGLFEAIRIRKAGYEVRMPIEAFVKRYKHCVLNAPSSIKTDIKVYAEHLVQEMYAKLEKDPVLRERKRVLEKNSSNNRSNQGKGNSNATVENKRQYFVGVSKVFLRSQVLKILFDEYRDLSAGNVVTHMQRIVRGFIFRMRVRKLMGQSLLLKEEEKSRRTRELSLMKQEEELSKQFELLLRSDTTLQKRLYDAKLKRIQEEKLRVAKQRQRACVLIQKMFRGYWYRHTSRVYMCERLLERALESRDETLMQRALQRPVQWKVSSKLIGLYRTSVKNLILEVMNENYVENQVLEAIEINSLDMLKKAIKLAEDHGMPYLAALDKARDAINLILANKTVVAILCDELAQCTTIPILVRKYDILQLLISEAYVRGLYHEQKVSETANRLQKIDKLVDLRQRLRSALEICSPTKMSKIMDERRKQVRIFGEDFLAEEAGAVESLNHMLRLKQTLLSAKTWDEDDREKGGDEEVKAKEKEKETDKEHKDGNKQLNMHEIYALVTGSGMVYSESSMRDSNEEMIYLPKFVRDPLLKMRYAKTKKEHSAALAEYVKLVPDAFHRKFYLRVFKWTIAFAFWNHPNEQMEQVRVAISTPQLLPSQNRDSAELSTAQLPISPSSSASLLSPKKILQQIKSSYNASTGRKADLTSTIKALHQQSLKSLSSPSKSLPRASSPTKYSPSNKNHIPFSQRQAKSEVAAREMLKKGRKQDYSAIENRTDSLLKKTYEDLRPVKGKMGPKCTF